MPRISNHNLYGIDDLSRAWTDGGWKGLAKIGAMFGLRLDTRRVPPQVWMLFREVYMDMGQKQVQDIPFEQVAWPVEHLLALATIAKGTVFRLKELREYVYSCNLVPYYGPECDAVFGRLLKRVITAFVGSKSIGDVLSKINEENAQRFAKINDWEELVSVRIGRKWAEAMGWLKHGLRGNKAFEEAFWNCVWAFTEPIITELMEIKRCIVDDIPPTDEQLDYLNSFMRDGYACGYRTTKCDGSETYEVCLEPRTPPPSDHPSYEPPGILNMAHILSIQPAFGLAQQLQRTCSKPRFVRQCRAPSCGQRFYTGRSNATSCPSKRSGVKSPCALEWVRYKRYLTKIDRDPEKDWDNEQLKKGFISYDKS